MVVRRTRQRGTPVGREESVTLSEVEEAVRHLGGAVTRDELLHELTLQRAGDYSPYKDRRNFETVAWQVVQKHTPGFAKYTGSPTFERTGRGAVRVLAPTNTPVATDIEEPSLPSRIRQETYRVLRDTELARSVKDAAGYRCQVCGEVLLLKNGRRYAEAHHLQPLGASHDGPDVRENIICVCPNHHALLDYSALELAESSFPEASRRYVGYHNSLVRSPQAK